MKRIVILAALLLMLSGMAVAQGTALLAWNDSVVEATHGPADYFILWRSEQSDTGFVSIGETEDMFCVDIAVPNDLRVYYRVSSVRGYLASNKGGPNSWASILWLDYTNGQFNTVRMHEYYPGDLRVLLVVWPPNNTCAVIQWDYGVMDRLSIECEMSPFPAPTLLIQE